ncbi:hypothetical protein P4V72_30450 [Bacillus thuringiensis]|nr:hypothetical protein [Bacillus thuringiensis]MEC3570219.1 hypothetical protein [Bacillus thuringiensis]MED2022359.1 hypothetical protein [Bacillus thuringiensis]MED2145418.1 hypothetical protein [Bacillus thuringiensis]MED2516571.1 hypothetical protein [Bacillus thuringiensis]
MVKKLNLRLGNEYYGTEKKEVLFQEIYEKYLGVKVTVTRKKKTEVKAS